MSGLEVCKWLEESWVGSGLAASSYMFPLVESTHVLALAFSVGTVAWFDMRLLGVWMRHQPVSRVFGDLKPWMLGGFAVMLATGALLFMALATAAYVHPYFRIKVLLLTLAGLNVAVFSLTIDRRRYEWDQAPTPPLRARIAGFVSLLLWAGVIAAGRIMAYTL
jgi:hypothetical protein